MRSSIILFPPREEDDPLRPSCGIVNGFLLSVPVWILIGLLVWALIALCSPAKAAGISLGSPPPGFFVCNAIRHDPACIIEPSTPWAVQENPETIAELEQVNAEVNWNLRNIACHSSDDVRNGPRGQPNYWASYAKPYAVQGRACVNCINYAATKRRALLERGFPANAVRFAIVHRYRDGENHAIVLVYTNKHPDDPFVLDSMGVDNNADIIWNLSDVLGSYKYAIVTMQDAQGAWHPVGK